MTTNTYIARVRRHRWRPPALWAAPFAALLILIPLAAACSGGSSSPGVANVDSTSTPANGSSSNGSNEGDLLAFSQCMRDNGISNFPDPSSDGGLEFDPSALGIEPDSPQFKAADEACKKYAPDGGEPPPEIDRAATLKYSQCMRDQGISNFPDPNPDGTISIDANKLGISPDSPQAEAANEACKQYLPDGGVFTDLGESMAQSGGGE